jgi:hypothetical protein
MDEVNYTRKTFDITFLKPIEAKWTSDRWIYDGLLGLEVICVTNCVVTIMLTYPYTIDPIKYISNQILKSIVFSVSMNHTLDTDSLTNFTNEALILDDDSIRVITNNLFLYLSVRDIYSVRLVSTCFNQNAKTIENDDYYWKNKLEYEYSMNHPLENMDIKWSYVYGIFTTYAPYIAASIFIFDQRIVHIYFVFHIINISYIRLIWPHQGYL